MDNYNTVESSSSGESDVVVEESYQPTSYIQQQRRTMNPMINPAYAAALSDTTRNTYSYNAPSLQAHTPNNNEGTAPVIPNDKSGGGDDNQSIGSIGSWEDSDNEGANNKSKSTAAAPLSAVLTANAAAILHEAPPPPASGATASYQNRNEHMPQWMNNNNNNNSTATAPTPYAAPQNYDAEPNPLHRTSTSNNSSYYYQPPPPPHRPPPTTHHHNYQQQQHNNSSTYYSSSNPSSTYSTHHSYHHHHHPPQHYDDTIEMPLEHTPTWQHILPADYFTKRKEQRRNQYGRSRRRFVLSLINLWEFTLTTESIDIYGQSNEEVFHGLRGPIKKIAKDHIGKDGRKGAIFERGADGKGILPDDPSLKQATVGLDANNHNTTTTNTTAGMGKWRIPLGAYQALFSYLTREGSVEGIPPEQLRAATLGRERADKKEYPSVKWLLDRGVSPVVAEALAPYQRGGVEFIIEKEGKALLADDMGLGKTIQAIAAMSAFKSDWPLLVLCPSTARYHWETEFRHWMGRESQSALKASSNNTTANGEKNGNITHAQELKHSQINVLTSGKDRILKADKSTKVVICSVGLIVNLVNSQRIVPGMFRATIVDESHVLKNKSTKRTKSVLPLLEAADRCLLLSGTPALAKPSELWPQLSVLGGRREGGGRYPSGIMCDYDDFMSKYVRGQSKTRLAELHTLLTSTVMMRRMKVDMLKNLPPKIREKAFIKIEDEKLQSEFTFYLRMLKEGKGLLGKLAKTHEIGGPQAQFNGPQFVPENGEEPLKNKEVLHHLYNLSGRSKVARITNMLKNWLNDPTKGKLCIFAHHLYVLDELARGAGLSNFRDSTTKFIRIDGSTSPKSRQEQILTFQTDPTVRIALLGITAAGVAVTLTASSTVWFAELFWTPAIMVQAEDRCHRIGQQATVRCLYFIAKGTLDEVLWKLIEKKFRDLGEFVEGKENMGIALERELEDDEEDEILKVEEAPDEAESRKRKAENLFEDLLDSDDLGLKAEIDELVHEEEEMLIVKGEDEDDDPDTAEGRETPAPSSAGNSSSVSGAKRSKPSNEAIILLDDDDDDDDGKAMTFSVAMQRLQDGIIQRIEPSVQCASENITFRDVLYPAYKSLGLLMVSFGGRVLIKGYTTPQDAESHSLNRPQIGAIIVAVNEVVIPQNSNFSKVLGYMRKLIMQGPVTLVFAEDREFMPWFKEVMIPRFDAQLKARTQAQAQAQNSNAKKEVIDLLDD